uniref:Uncharacterized protein n=1 Tax=viral metagenome TaxID=1070528 RepID=A0A6C0LLZ0_9ZZZZ
MDETLTVRDRYGRNSETNVLVEPKLKTVHDLKSGLNLLGSLRTVNNLVEVTSDDRVTNRKVAKRLNAGWIPSHVVLIESVTLLGSKDGRAETSGGLDVAYPVLGSGSAVVGLKDINVLDT